MLLSLKLWIWFAGFFSCDCHFYNWISSCSWRSNIFQLYSCNKSRSMRDNLSIVLSLLEIKCFLYALILHLQQFTDILWFHLKIIFNFLSQNSSYPSICPHETTRLLLEWISRIFENFSRKFVIKFGKE